MSDEAINTIVEHAIDKDTDSDVHNWRVQDGWGRRNLSSRMIVVTMIILMLGMLTGFFMGFPVPDGFWSSIIWASALIVVVYAIGPSALEQASDLVSNIKGFR
jgi:uncharacterized membrane protein